MKVEIKHNGIDYRIIISCIISITIIECFALAKGMNGLLLSLAIAVVAGLGGIVIPNPIKIK